MRMTIRTGVFETNSSSTHSISICTKAEFQQWERGLLEFDRDYECFVEVQDKLDPDDEWRYLSFDDVFGYDNDKIGMDTYKMDYVTPGGEEIVAFGWYGYAY